MSSLALSLFVAESLDFALPNVIWADGAAFAATFPNENVLALLTAAVALEPNEKPLCGAVAALLPKENVGLAAAIPLLELSAAPCDPSRACSQHAHFDFDTSFPVRHVEHSQVLFCLSTIALNILSTGLDVSGVAFVDDGNVPKLNVGFGGAVLFTVTFEDAFGLAAPQQAHVDCACKRNIK